MKTNIIKWDKSMAVRCLAKCNNFYVNAAFLPLKMHSHKAAAAKASPICAISVNIPVGEWDGFEYAINSAVKKNHK